MRKVRRSVIIKTTDGVTKTHTVTKGLEFDSNGLQFFTKAEDGEEVLVKVYYDMPTISEVYVKSVMTMYPRPKEVNNVDSN